MLISDIFTYISNAILLTRKRALHARMSHSTACNKTVSTKNTRRKLVK